MGERRDFERPYHNTQGGDSSDWLEEAPPLHMPQMDIADANLFGMERFLEGEGPPEQAEQAPTLRLRGAESRGLSSPAAAAPLRMTGGRGSHESQERPGSGPSLSERPAGPSANEPGTTAEARPPAGRDSSTLDPALGSSIETAGPTGGSRSDSRGSVQTGRRSEGGTTGQPRAPGGAKRRGKRKLPVPDLDAIEDPLERRKQRRLLKNRNTAAASRERKQRDLDALTGRLTALERDNAALRALLASRDGEIGELGAQVVSLSERLGEGPPSEAPPSTSSGDAAAFCGAAQQQPRPRGTVSGSGRAARGAQHLEPLLGLHQGRPLPACEHLGSAGTPGLVVGVDGQWLRLRPGYELSPPGPYQGPPQQQQQQQQEEREDEEDDDEGAEVADDGGRDSDPQWEPGRKARKKGRRSA